MYRRRQDKTRSRSREIWQAAAEAAGTADAAGAADAAGVGDEEQGRGGARQLRPLPGVTTCTKVGSMLTITLEDCEGGVGLGLNPVHIVKYIVRLATG